MGKTPKPLVPHRLQDEKEVGINIHAFLSTCLDVVTPLLGDGAKGEVHRARARGRLGVLWLY